MDEYDEDVDPLAGPIADLMAEHSLSSTTPMSTSKTQNPTDFLHVPPTKTKLFDLLVHLNLRSHFRQVFAYLLDKLWYHYLHETCPKTDQDIILNHPSPTKLISLLVISILLILLFPFIFCMFIVFLIIIDFLIPLYIYHIWFDCLRTTREFLHTVQTHQQWLVHIHGFQLIRPTSSLFENQLHQLRQQIFIELQNSFLLSRQIARQHSTANEQLICYIDLEEFGPLIQSNPAELDKLTNQFDQVSVNSIFKLAHLQINECIQLIHLTRPSSYWTFVNFQKKLLNAMKRLNKTKQDCSIMIDYTDLETNPSPKRLISSYFLLRSSCEQLFQMNESNSANPEQLKRIIQDVKTVIHSLEAMQAKPIVKANEDNSEELLTKDGHPSNITSYHRFDDEIEETTDEILICHTGKSFNDGENDEMAHSLDLNDYEQQLLREQTNCLMKELQTAIQGKKQDWNEREQRLLGAVDQAEDEPLPEIKQEVVDEEPFEKLSSMSNTISMLDELKHTFVLNRKKLNINEDIFGEDDIGDFDDEDN